MTGLELKQSISWMNTLLSNPKIVDIKNYGTAGNPFIGIVIKPNKNCLINHLVKQ